MKLMKFNNLVNYVKSNSLFIYSPIILTTTSTHACICTEINDGKTNVGSFGVKMKCLSFFM